MDKGPIIRLRDRVCVALAAASGDLARHLRLRALGDALDRLIVIGALFADPAVARPAALVEQAIAATDELDRAVAALADGDLSAAALCDGLVVFRRELAAAVAEAVPAMRSAMRSPPRTTGPATTATTAGPDSAVPALVPVRFGAAAPTAVRPGDRFVAQFVVYPEDARDAARALLTDGSGVGEANVISDFGGDALAVGTVLQVALSGEGLKVEGKARSVQTVRWAGRTARLVFEVFAASVDGIDGTVLRYDVLVDGLVLARVRLPLRIADRPDQRLEARDDVAFAKTAFASYSSKDRERVIDRVAAIRIAAQVDVFLDCHDLNPGAAWEDELAKRIDGCDTFMLFWSDAAAESPWVKWEWKRALAQRGLDHMQIHPLENHVKPPPPLRSLHVGDDYMALRAAERLYRTTHPSPGT